ncbi:UL17 protein [Suid alphaherpesvirus 1]|uniref:UL17 n=1 Tax=Suid herpesvirus 1 TaxID=10345 RepID=Q80PZ0_SUHV|nr:UL17 [Suid alphaherpesvirus 1]ANZ03070.1 UL17 protein [Suid alphaherpesvirus 1]
MDAHIANETKQQMTRFAPALVHVIVPDPLLRRAGVDPLAPFAAHAQTRYHGSGVCEPWVSVFAGHVQTGAVESVLTLPPLQRARGPGGLFVSLPLALGAHFDGFTAVALRVGARELIFTYDELLPARTRYNVDGERLERLCRQFANYARARRVAPEVAAAGGHIDALLPPAAATIDGEAQLTRGGFDDPAAPHARDADREILSLVRRADELVAARHPVRSHVASGLMQGALARRGGDGGGSGALEAAAAVPAAPREAAGGGDGGGAAWRDELLLTPQDPRPLTALDWLDAGYAALAGGDAPAHVWRRRPVSLVARRHYQTGETFVVVAYEHSTAWGGRRGPASEPLARVLAEECERHGVEHPRALPAEARLELVRRHAELAVPLGDEEPPLPVFDATAELVLLERFRNACVRALLAGVRESVRREPRMRQIIEFAIRPRDREAVLDVAGRAPALLDAFARRLEQTPAREMVDSGLMTAAAAHLAARATAGYVTFESGPLLGGVFLFDYYSAGGEVIRVTRAPPAVAVEPATRGQFACRFRGASHRCLPGESYAYLCVGVSRDLRALVVLPGGFGFFAALRLEWPAALVDPVLERLCRRV